MTIGKLPLSGRHHVDTKSHGELLKHMSSPSDALLLNTAPNTPGTVDHMVYTTNTSIIHALKIDNRSKQATTYLAL